MAVGEGTVQWEIQGYDGNIMGPYYSLQVQQAFLQGKLCLESRVRLVGHAAFKPLMTYWHILDEALSEARKADSAKRNAAAAASAAAALAAAAERRKAAAAAVVAAGQGQLQGEGGGAVGEARDEEDLDLEASRAPLQAAAALEEGGAALGLEGRERPEHGEGAAGAGGGEAGGDAAAWEESAGACGDDAV